MLAGVRFSDRSDGASVKKYYTSLTEARSHLLTHGYLPSEQSLEPGEFEFWVNDKDSIAHVYPLPHEGEWPE